jgi:hypothetical protein
MKLFVRAAPGHEFMIGNAALGHPIDGPVGKDGSYWESDFFTFRMRNDGDIVVDDTVEPLTTRAPGPEALRAVSRSGEPE